MKQLDAKLQAPGPLFESTGKLCSLLHSLEDPHFDPSHFVFSSFSEKATFLSEVSWTHEAS